MKELYRDGKLSSEKYFDNGYPTGTWKHYDSNGFPLIKTEYKNGKKNGSEIYYHYNSYQPSTITKYKNGLEHGKKIGYFENGRLGSEGYYIDGKEEGNRIIYWNNGNISHKIKMKNGKAISGTWWEEDGRLGGLMTNAQFQYFLLEY